VLGETELVLRGTDTMTGNFRHTSRTIPTITS
jgi:hypothetical protein